MCAQADLLIHEQMRKHNVQPPGAEVERPMNNKYALTLAGAAFPNHFDEGQISLNVEELRSVTGERADSTENLLVSNRY